MTLLPRIAACVTLLACTERVQLEDDPLAGLVTLEVAPGDLTVSITDLMAPAREIDYAATGTFRDGTTRDVTAFVDWRVDNPNPGRFVARGLYETSQAAGGHVVVQAAADSVVATATLRVWVTLTVVDGEYPPPVGAEGLFADGTPIVTDPMRSPAILYPADATRFPQRLARILFQYKVGMMNNAFRLTFESDVLYLTILTGTDRWQPDGTIWTLIAASHGGTQTRFTVQGASSTTPGTIYTSLPETLAFTREAPGGVLYYWSAARNKIVRGALSASTATPFYPGTGNTTCVGCHTMSRDGTQMAFGYGGETLQTIDVTSLATRIDAATKRPMGWAAFSPDRGALVLVADKGTLTLLDASTGAPYGSPNGHVALSLKATHPDWSPDGSYVAITLSSDAGNMDVKSGSIARLPFHDGTFGPPEILVAGAGMDNNFFPRYSPDGRFIAYVHATGAAHGAKSAELRLIRADGGTPIPLTRASHHIALGDQPDLADTMPIWGPMSGDVAWIAFASARPYGAIMPMGDHSQIWVTGLDLSRADDPSASAFWLPCQDVRVLNNNPIWTVESATLELGDAPATSTDISLRGLTSQPTQAVATDGIRRFR